ncbi:MAG: protein kinase domain-containing protein [Methylocystis sp.]|uniref:protein kinase domain-containing protein n=1 Tax=Methylocystis sp. TaxID=1911079 RepID=UPI003DA3044E
MKGQSLTVGARPGAVEIRTFLAGLDKNAKLKAKPDSHGNMILYASTKRSNILSRMTGRAAEKRNAARQLIDRSLDGIESRAHRGAVNGGMRAPAETAFSDIRNFFNRSSKTALRVKAARVGLETGTAVAEAASARGKEKAGAPLDKLGDLQAHYARAAEHLLNGDTDAAIASLGEAIGAAARERFTDAEKDAFAFSANIGLRQRIDAALEKALGDKFNELLPPGAKRDAFLRQTASLAASKVLQNRQIDDNTLLIGGKTYTKATDERHPDGKIGVGGFADVYLYQRQKDDGSVEKIAVKFSRPSPDEGELDQQLEEFGHEVLVHKAAVESGSPNIIGLEGGLRTADGRIAIALEFAPNGDLFGMIDKLKDAVAANRISPQAAAAVRLTLLRDMAIGVAALERQGILNGDAKPPNVLIGLNGEAKIADLGTAQVASSYVLENSNRVDNPRWLAPEVLAAQDSIKTIEGLQNWDLRRLAKSATEKVLDAVGMPAGTPLIKLEKRMISHLLSPLVDSQKQRVSAGAKGDAWALGMTGFNLLYGQESPIDSAFNSDVQKGVLDFGRNADNRAISGAGGFAAPSGFGAEDDLINNLLHPDPEQRLSAQEALGHRAFAAPGVGSPQARELIVALMKDDAEGMAQASAHFSPPTSNPNRNRPLPATPGAVG